MGPVSAAEIEQAFIRYWRTGAVGEDWDAWADLFTADARYVEHVLGAMQGREAIRAWIKPIMAQYGEIYTAYEWHVLDPASGRVCVYMQNRRDHPSGTGVIDFPGSRSCTTREAVASTTRRISGPSRARTKPPRSTRRRARPTTASTGRR